MGIKKKLSTFQLDTSTLILNFINLYMLLTIT